MRLPAPFAGCGLQTESFGIGHILRNPAILRVKTATMTEYSDADIASESLLGDFSEVAELHVPHGHRHMSEFTHTLLGVSIAKQIASLVH